MKIHTDGNQIVDFEANYPFQITANDTSDITLVGSKIHCNQSGNYNLVLEGSDTALVFFLVAGVTYPFRVRKVKATDTDYPTGLIGLAAKLEA